MHNYIFITFFFFLLAKDMWHWYHVCLQPSVLLVLPITSDTDLAPGHGAKLQHLVFLVYPCPSPLSTFPLVQLSSSSGALKECALSFLMRATCSLDEFTPSKIFSLFFFCLLCCHHSSLHENILYTQWKLSSGKPDFKIFIT